MESEKKDILYISCQPTDMDSYNKTLKVAPELHAQVSKLARKANLNISRVANLLVAFALARVELVDDGTVADWEVKDNG